VHVLRSLESATGLNEIPVARLSFGALYPAFVTMQRNAGHAFDALRNAARGSGSTVEHRSGLSHPCRQLWILDTQHAPDL